MTQSVDQLGSELVESTTSSESVSKLTIEKLLTPYIRMSNWDLNNLVDNAAGIAMAQFVLLCRSLGVEEAAALDADSELDGECRDIQAEFEQTVTTLTQEARR